MRRSLLSLVFCLVCCSGCAVWADLDAVTEPQCALDEECDDGLFCTGVERCEPGAASADDFGCAPGDIDALLDDGIACTVQSCDEENDRVLLDASACECEGDFQCATMTDALCETARCDETFRCVVEATPVGEECDDGIFCTRNTTCNAGGECVLDEESFLDSAACDDGVFCNGTELCAPDDPEAQAETGCVDGVSPILTEEGDDGVECTVAICVEEERSVVHEPATCECRAPEDCVAQVGLGCFSYRCDKNTSFTCVQDERMPEGTACDDGASCTVDDHCNTAGVCVGTPSQNFCDDADMCNGQELCTPEDESASSDGCVAGTAPDPLPEACVE